MRHYNQRPAYARHISWVCPNCRKKNSVRLTSCERCAWKKDGLNRKPSRKDFLRMLGITIRDVSMDDLAQRRRPEFEWGLLAGEAPKDEEGANDVNEEDLQDKPDPA